MNTQSDEKARAQEIRRHAHRLAAAGIRAALNQWELDLYYDDPEDQRTLELELVAITVRLDKRGGAR